MHVHGSNGATLSVPPPNTWGSAEYQLQLDRRFTWKIRAEGQGGKRDVQGLKVNNKRWLPEYTTNLDSGAQTHADRSHIYCTSPVL